MFCGNCGKKLPDGATVCDACGAPVESTAVVEADKKIAEKTEEMVVKAEEAVSKVEEEVPAVSEPTAADAGEATSVSEMMINGETVGQKTASEQGEQGKKKINLPLLIGGAVAAVVIIVALIFLCSASARNSIKKLFLSDESYFCDVTESKLDEIADTFFSGYSKLMKIAKASDFETAVNAEFEFEDDAEDLLEKSFNADWLKKGELKFTTGWNDKKVYANTSLNVNKEDILKLDASLDPANGKAYIGIPTLSKDYAAFDLEEMMGNDFAEFAESVTGIFDFADVYPTEKELRAIYERYKEIAFSHIKKVKLSNDKSYTVEGVKMTGCTKAVTELDFFQFRDLMLDVLNAASEDNEIAAIIQRLSANEMLDEYLSKSGKNSEDLYDSFLDSVDELILQLEKLDETDILIKIEAYIASDGDVCALEVSLTEDGGADKGGSKDAFGYKYAVNSPNYGINLYRTKETRYSSNTLELLADGTMSGNKFSGTVAYRRNDYVYGELDFSDVNLASLKKFILDGTLKFEINGLSKERDYKKLSLEVKADDVSVDGGNIETILHNSKVKLGEMDVKIKTGSGSKVKEPSKKLDIMAADDLTDWLDGFKWEDTISNLEDADFPRTVIKAIESLSEGDYLGLLGSFIN